MTNRLGFKISNTFEIVKMYGKLSINCVVSPENFPVIYVRRRMIGMIGWNLYDEIRTQNAPYAYRGVHKKRRWRFGCLPRFRKNYKCPNFGSLFQFRSDDLFSLIQTELFDFTKKRILYHQPPPIPKKTCEHPCVPVLVAKCVPLKPYCSIMHASLKQKSTRTYTHTRVCAPYNTSRYGFHYKTDIIRKIHLYWFLPCLKSSTGYIDLYFAYQIMMCYSHIRWRVCVYVM